MSVIDWLNSGFDITDAIYFFIAFVIWAILWNLINIITCKILKKCDLNYDLLNMGPILGSIASFGIAVFLSLILLLLVASIQGIIQYGIKLLFPFLIFWGVIISFFVYLIKYLIKK
jgi:hypothetical protein